MMSIKNPVHHMQNPVLEENHNPLTPNEIHKLFSLVLESEQQQQQQQQQPSSNRSSSSSETNRSIYTVEERKHRRMASNRESARRSRRRKKTHVENITNEVNRLKIENRELKNMLCVLSHDCHLVQSDSDRLLSESIYLQHKLAGLHQILAYSTAQQLQY
ncbi:hypothetical protein ACP275_14G276700 [Erythranthe tilingii]